MRTPTLSMIRTHHGTWFSSHPNGRDLSVTDQQSDPNVLIGLELSPERIALAPASPSIPADPRRRPVWPAIRSRPDVSSWTCLTLDDGRLLTTTPHGRIETDRRIIGDWERYELIPTDKPTPIAFQPLIETGLHDFAEGEGPDDAHARSFLADGAEGRHASSLDAALIGILGERLLRDLVPALRDRSDYASLFPALQSRLSRGQRRSEWHTLAHLGPDLPPGWHIGDHTYGAPEIIDGEYGTLDIGRYCSIAGGVRIVVANHAIDTLTTYPFAALDRIWPSAPDPGNDHAGTGVVIGSSVWIGVGATILPGARIGHGAILGAGCVVAGTIPPYAVAVGNPARITRLRYDEVTIRRLLEVAWWNWPDHEVDRAIPFLMSDDASRLMRFAAARN